MMFAHCADDFDYDSSEFDDDFDDEFHVGFDYDVAGQSTWKALPTSWFERLRNFYVGPMGPSTFKDFLFMCLSILREGWVWSTMAYGGLWVMDGGLCMVDGG